MLDLYCAKCLLTSNMTAAQLRLSREKFNGPFCERCGEKIDEDNITNPAEENAQPEGMADHDEQDRRAYREELNDRPKPSEY